MEFENHFYVIIGAGAAGLQFAYYCGRHNRDYIVLERKPAAGGQFSFFPRHRGLISINKVYTGETDYEKNMRWDWNSLLLEEEDRDKQPLFKTYNQDYFPNADWLVTYMRDFAKNLKLKVNYNQEVERISKKNGTFRVYTNGGKNYSCTALINCSGYSKAFLPAIAGIETCEHYPTMQTDPQLFINQRVLILGKGNSGFETADKLIPTAAVIHILSPSPIKFAWKTHYIGHVRALNSNFLDTYQLKSQNAVLDATIERIHKKEDNTYDVTVNYSHALGESETLNYDRVLNCTGFSFDTGLFDMSCKPDVAFKGKFPAQKPNWESTNIDNLFFMGVLSHCLDHKKTTSGFIHGFRYNTRVLFRLLDLRFFKEPFPSYDIPCTVDGLLKACLDRANQSSGLWQQFGYLRDLITVDPDQKRMTYHEELSEFQIPCSNAIELDDYYEFSLEFNKVCGDPFNIQRAPVADRAAESIFLHPVLRHYKKGNLVGEKHLLEDLYTDWTHPIQHVLPFNTFITEQFAIHSAPTMGPKYNFEYRTESWMPQAQRDHMMISPAKIASKM
jgi:thioredoxin reductase